MNLLKGRENFLESQLYVKIKERINHFLAEAIGNIVSAGFKFLCKTDLEENEAKEFASKNIMLNINSIYQQTVKAIIENKQLKEMGNVENMEKIKLDLVMEVNNMVNNILLNTADNYPQAPASGGTPRMRDVITDVNRVDNPDNDLIYNSGIKIKDYV